MFQPADDALPDLGCVFICQRTVGSLVGQAVGQAFFTGTDLPAAEDVKQAGFFEQFTAALQDGLQHADSRHIFINNNSQVFQHRR